MQEPLSTRVANALKIAISLPNSEILSSEANQTTPKNQ